MDGKWQEVTSGNDCRYLCALLPRHLPGDVVALLPLLLPANLLRNLPGHLLAHLGKGGKKGIKRTNRGN